MNALVQLDNVTFRAGERTLLSNINLTLKQGEIISLIGPNGAGKTTLVRLILGLIKPSSGHIARRGRLRIGYMPQKLQLNAGLPLNVVRFLALADRKPERIQWAIEHAGARHLANHSMHKLSGGETQRVLLARALLARPDLLILDEPAQGVDISGQQAMYQKISDLREELGCAILVVSHDLHWVMAQTDSVICLNQHICCHGHPETVSADPAYLKLFGERGEPTLVPYRHHHDHEHTMHGDVVAGVEHEGCRHD